MAFLQEYAHQKIRFGAFTTHYYTLLSSSNEELAPTPENIRPEVRIVHVLKYPGRRKYFDITPALITLQRKVKEQIK